PSMRCVGYRQAWQALDEGQNTEWLREKACAATRQLAKRQLTWLRSMPQRRSITVDADSTVQGLADEVVRLIASGD
ncbi:MAG: tRNA (adenosine(37)-N6)-dimethylallyltransferase MiaA, partial [Ottowia sp.]|nr:tRNA (adenosine(37)-N6)-dimethylallyltransferase MiaA [Ottowia sp.]